MYLERKWMVTGEAWEKYTGIFWYVFSEHSGNTTKLKMHINSLTDYL